MRNNTESILVLTLNRLFGNVYMAMALNSD